MLVRGSLQAEAYGTPQFGAAYSESLLGQFIKENPNGSQCEVATKFAALPWRVGSGSVSDALRQSLTRYSLSLPHSRGGLDDEALSVI